MSKKKFYTVWNGRQTGVFDNWNDCEAQVKRFSGAKFKSFNTREAAEDAFKNGSTSPEIVTGLNNHHRTNDDFPWE